MKHLVNYEHEFFIADVSSVSPLSEQSVMF